MKCGACDLPEMMFADCTKANHNHLPNLLFTPSHRYTMLTPQLLRSLTMDPARHPRGQAHLSAASGLVQVQERFYVVADDEHHLGRFKTAIDSPVKLQRLFPGDLPMGDKERKAKKPDLETLAILPIMARYPHGALLALGSGSKPARERGVLLALDAQGRVGKEGCLPPKRIDLSGLYKGLRETVPLLNIEGCFVANGVLHILQRGNQADARSACIRLDWHHAQAWLLDEDNETPRAVQVNPIDLSPTGPAHGVALSITDACSLPEGAWAFSAVAENTKDSYHDGPCIASAVGIVNQHNKVVQLHHLQGAPKVEGISARVLGTQLSLTMVTDADDPGVASQLLQVQLAWG
jgi:hypothetical protein